MFDCRYCEATGFQVEAERDAHEKIDCNGYKAYCADCEEDARREISRSNLAQEAEER